MIFSSKSSVLFGNVSLSAEPAAAEGFRDVLLLAEPPAVEGFLLEAVILLGSLRGCPGVISGTKPCLLTL